MIQAMEEKNGLTNYVPEPVKTRQEILRVRIPQHYDRTKVMVTKAGKTYNQYDFIQEFKDDTEIYTVMDKYNLTVDEARQRMMSNLPEIKGFFDMNEKFSDKIAQLNQAKEMFENLPLEVRNKFGGSMERFLNEGEKYINELYEQTTQYQQSEPKEGE